MRMGVKTHLQQKNKFEKGDFNAFFQKEIPMKTYKTMYSFR